MKVEAVIEFKVTADIDYNELYACGELATDREVNKILVDNLIVFSNENKYIVDLESEIINCDIDIIRKEFLIPVKDSVEGIVRVEAADLDEAIDMVENGDEERTGEVVIIYDAVNDLNKRYLKNEEKKTHKIKLGNKFIKVDMEKKTCKDDHFRDSIMNIDINMDDHLKDSIEIKNIDETIDNEKRRLQRMAKLMKVDASHTEREVFYYLRDKENKPIVTVCLLMKDNYISRGIAICSEKDIPSKKNGRRISKARALHAIGTQASFGPIYRTEAMYIVTEVVSLEICEIYPSDYKAEFDPELSLNEKRLLGV